MKIRLAGKKVDLRHPKVMGMLYVTEGEALADFISRALQMQEAGAEFVQVGLRYPHEESSAEAQEALLTAIEHLTSQTSLLCGVCSSRPEIMEQAVRRGASFIVDHKALREEGALELVARLRVPVLLVYERDPKAGTISEFDRKTDLVAEISEFFFERIDACLGAKISRSQLMIDPSVDLRVPTNLRLKLLGRLPSLRSFGLPISLNMPAILPATQDFLNDNRAIGIALALFATQHGVNIVRTEHVSDMTMSIATWQLAAQQAKPFNLSRGIISRFKKLRDRIRVHKNQG